SRSSVSRGYYAAFHAARELLEDLGFTVPRGERAHAYLWLRLSNCGEPQVQDAGRRLNTVRGQRNRADYDVRASFSRRTADGQVRIGEGIIQVLDTAILEPTQITDTMKIYERNV